MKLEKKSSVGPKNRIHSFLAHLSRRLIGELIRYSWSGVCPSSVINNVKHLLLQNRLPDQSQILCGASLGMGNESLFAASGSNDQDGRHAHIWLITLQKSSSPEPAGRFSRNLVCSIGIRITSPRNVYPLTPHFYIVKLGFAGVYIFSYFCFKT